MGESAGASTLPFTWPSTWKPPASVKYFDPGESNYRDGYQSPPVKWGLNTERKRQFFERVREMSGY